MGVVTVIQDVFSDYYHEDDEELCKSCIDVDNHYTNMNFDTCYTLIGVECRVGHDGYDKYGPESNLFDVYVFYKKNDVGKDSVGNGGTEGGSDGDVEGGTDGGNGDDKVNIFMDIWHAEQWFDKNEIVMLELSETYLFTEREDYQKYVSWVHKGGFFTRPLVSADTCVYKNYGVWDDWDDSVDAYEE